MLRDGIYRIHYPGHLKSKRKLNTALASFRCGDIFGSDEFGGVYHGHQDQDASRGEQPINIAVKMPPYGQLITGHRAQDGPAMLEMQNSSKLSSDPQMVMVRVNGVPVEIEICYLGPLPA